jgi:methyltransferase
MELEHLSLFIPSSITAETKDLKIKTYKIGLIGRSAAIFKADMIVIYEDSEKGEAKYINDILTYMNTPQYLRKRVFPITKELKYVGILPPLRTPHHPTGKPVEGDYRQGLTIKRVKKGTIVDIGADRLALCKEKLSVNKILNFKIKRLAKEIIIEPDKPDAYLGFEVISTYKDLYESIMDLKPDLIIGTSSYAAPITSILDEVKTKIENAKHLAILFGSPHLGLYQILKGQENILDLEVNTVPSQGTETIRTEEAVLASLSVFNLFLNTE